MPTTRTTLVADTTGSTTWSVVSNPGPVAFSNTSSPTAVVAATQPGSYVFEASGSNGRQRFEVTVSPNAFVQTAATTPTDYFAAQIKPNYRSGNTLPPLGSSSIQTHPALLKELADNWGWGLQTGVNIDYCDPDPVNAAGASRGYNGSHNDEIVAIAVAGGGRYKLTLSTANLLPKGDGKKWATPGSDANDQPAARGINAQTRNFTTPESVWYNDGKGNGVASRMGRGGVPDTTAATNPIFSPLAPDSWVRARVQDASRCIAKFQARFPVTLIADFAEYGSGNFDSDFCLALNDPATLAAVGYSGRPDRSCYRTISGQPESRIDDRDTKLARLLGRATIRNYQITRDEFAAATRRPDGVSAFFNVYGNSYGYDRGRWNGWVNFYAWLEDEGANKTSFAAGTEHYFKDFNSGFEGIDPNAQCAPTDIMFKTLNDVGGNIANGIKNSYPWISAGFRETASDKTGIADRARWMGYTKMLFISGALGAMPGYFNYGFENYEGQQVRNQAIGTKLPNWIWPIADLSQVQATFSWFETYLRDGDLVQGATAGGATTHPYAVDTTPVNFYALQLKGNEFTRPSCFDTTRNYAPTAYVMARKLPGQEKYLFGAWANVGADREVTAMVPGKGEVTLKARVAGSIYLAERDGAGAWTTKLIDLDPMYPSALIL